ncbi:MULTISPECIES: 16S rRNA (guanine(527)-N(7))-methyltransferase RsmG [unclassified Oceanispirochaeta]|uniref:16S rRNA (guanine(527)-N(7))-methyltransferase RsmG n=1 Tax=unclassified Oceanispirochaeta TaxID=2635722 RepID=UPI000E092FE1|nr:MULTISPECIES: 16S rRNA (guanine(527)-N(7))-methyltransferase RsmG [unclassified Oceanispirochaeta]MBF9018510.1 16S rRNA (guanine(527)-N(7))-methyltransferase RsmG [Oceanispirochaeta sp. M2]NPD74917.1 16S rRNA (guanine(527)-N(7))-methyltransferase RsmG [Oceanispirochaeta sp. M1]RDG29248.1 16S rRNA (guanine(527)-N(7))-methyltransferase RsmG [Oceanispirochaeta sp. M1]
MGILENGLARMGLAPDSEKVELLEKYIKELELWNPRYGLVNAEGDDLVVRHILDSLAGVKTMQGLAPSVVADIGSGAGLPGIPLAIMLPHIRFHLVERSGKRTGFLRNIILTLGLTNVSVLEETMEKLTDRYEVVTFRAFSPFQNDLMKHLKKILCEDKGTVLAYKGRRELIDKELNSLDEDPVRETSIVNVDVPFLDEERHLVIMHLQ